MPIPITKRCRLVEEFDDEYEGVAYDVSVYEELSESGRESRYVVVDAKHLNDMKNKWCVSLEDRTIMKYLSWIPSVRGRPMTKEEHIDFVLTRFQDEVDEYNEFKRQSAKRNNGISVKGDGVAEVTLGEEDDND